MSKLDERIKELTNAAIDIANIPNPTVRHKGGWWLNTELVSLFNSHVFSQEQRLNFMVVTKIMLDVIFADATDNPDGFEEMSPPTETLIEDIISGHASPDEASPLLP